MSGDDAIDPLARERSLSTRLFNVAWTRGAEQVVGYAYLHQDRDVPAASTVTEGLRWTGTRLREGNGPGWTLEAARQRNHAGNPRTFEHAYWLLEPSYAWRGVVWRAGWEHLGGNGAHALQAPLGTLHAFNGWADRFAVTPPGGLDDRYVAAAGRLGHGRLADRLDWSLARHDYRADHGGRYGSEWNAALGLAITPKLAALLKLADYRGAADAADTSRLWLQMEWKQ